MKVPNLDSLNKNSDKIDSIFPLNNDRKITYVLPVLDIKSNLGKSFRLAKGWRFFRNLIIIQEN